MRGAQEAFYLDVWLDPHKKQFGLPAFFIDLSDGFGGQLEVIGQEDILFARVRVLITDTPKKNGTFPSLDARKLNGLIRDDALFYSWIMRLDYVKVKSLPDGLSSRDRAV